MIYLINFVLCRHNMQREGKASKKLRKCVKVKIYTIVTLAGQVTLGVLWSCGNVNAIVSLACVFLVKTNL